MPSATVGQTPSLSTYLKSLKHNDIETSIELFISLLKRRQIKNSRPCAIATISLLLRVVGEARTRDAQQLIERIRAVGRRLVAAQPREMAVGNIVRRVLENVREVAERDQDAADGGSEGSTSIPSTPIRGETMRRPAFPTKFSEFSPLHGAATIPQDMHARAPLATSGDSSPAFGGTMEAALQRPPLVSSNTSYAGQGPAASSLFSILQHPQGRSPYATPPTGTQSPALKASPFKGDEGQTSASEKLDIKAEVITSIQDLQKELEEVDDEISEFAQDHIHNNEVILTHTSSQTVQRFLMKAASKKRKFTVFHAEAYPNDHLETHATIVNGGGATAEDADERWKPLTSMGITVILIPDSAVFALMSRINKVILAPHTVLANGSLIAAAGASTIAQAAKTHRVPVVVLSGVFKLSPVYPFDTDELIEYGDPGKVVPFQDGEFMDKVDVVNPVYDFVDAELIDLYITNLGGHAPSYLYRIVADHYRVEDIDLSGKAEGGAVKAG
ncbi:hypothetical protein LTR36_005003 [Oleoguttula mirabilis]|uniref:Translation initiation factor eIF2B subunit beta n=1 Tax=Oleoguttula mirabilis TaxID=1507867 RepID=A0AAV9JVE2_9PEZI|nr:hypothetical protein LTR36_005003 [Oleoguttula mirabilis]